MKWDGSLEVWQLKVLYQTGQLDPIKVVKECYRRIEAYEAKGNHVWIYLLPLDTILASLPESSRSNLPLYGIPFAVKDNFDVAGLPTTAGCPEFAYIPKQTAPAIQKLLDAGAILMGKTNMDQFATGLTGCRSVYGTPASVIDFPNLSSGGSSSGSAIAVAADLVSFAMGTDTAGSIRVPAAFNRIVGFKPTKETCEIGGIVPACKTLDCVGIFSKNIECVRRVYDVIKTLDQTDSMRVPPKVISPVDNLARVAKGFIFGVPSRQYFQDKESYFTHNDFARVIASLEALGGNMREIDYAPFHQLGPLMYDGAFMVERLASFKHFLDEKDGWQHLHPETLNAFRAAQRFTAVDVWQDIYKAQKLRLEALKEMDGIDVLVTPTAPFHPGIEECTAKNSRIGIELGAYTNFVNMIGLSAVALPVVESRDKDDRRGYGITIMAKGFEDCYLLQLASHLDGCL